MTYLIHILVVIALAWATRSAQPAVARRAGRRSRF